MNKRNLRHLHFIIWADTDTKDKILCEGPHHSIYKYLHKDADDITNDDLKEATTLEDLRIANVDEFEVSAIDTENNFLFDPIPADKWLEWYDNLAVQALSENSFSDDVMVEYPDAGTDLTEL